MNFEFVGQAETRTLPSNSLNQSEVYIIKDEDDDEIILIEDDKPDQSDIESPPVTNSAPVQFPSSPDCFIINTSNNNKHICDICNRAFKSQGACLMHRRKHVLCYTCNVCDFKCNLLTELMTHALVHDNLKYACGECDFKCDDEKEMQRHKIIHATSELFACIKCNFQCTNSWALQMHLHKIHNKPLQCEICQFSCLDLHKLKCHKKKHCNTLFECNQCIFECHSSEELAVHNESEHSKIIPDDNQICDDSQQFTYYSTNFANNYNQCILPDVSSVGEQSILPDCIDNDYQCILPDVSPPGEQSILPECVNNLTDSNPDDGLPVITNVHSTATVKPQQFFVNIPVKFNTQMIIPQNNENNPTISQSDRGLGYGLNDNQKSNQVYYILQDACIDDYITAVTNPTDINKNNSPFNSVASQFPVGSLSHPKSGNRKPISPGPKPPSALNSVKRRRHSEVLQAFVIDKTDLNLSNNKKTNSTNEPKQPHQLGFEETVNNCLSNSKQTNGKPNFQYEFANFLQSKLVNRGQID